MKVKDLRIGNIVFGGWEDYEENSNHSICLVTGLSEDQQLGEGWNFMLENMETKGVENYFEMKPIPLDEEWLLKFNFKIEEIHAGLSEADFGHNPITQDFILTIKNTGSGWFYRNSHFKLDYVHQLQNLYFALCGEELELK